MIWGNGKNFCLDDEPLTNSSVYGVFHRVAHFFTQYTEEKNIFSLLLNFPCSRGKIMLFWKCVCEWRNHVRICQVYLLKKSFFCVNSTSLTHSLTILNLFLIFHLFLPSQISHRFNIANTWRYLFICSQSSSSSYFYDFFFVCAIWNIFITRELFDELQLSQRSKKNEGNFILFYIFFCRRRA